MNSQSESKADGSQQTPSHMTKTFYDTLSDYLPVSSQTKNSTRTRIKSLRETDSRKKSVSNRKRESDKESISPTTTKRELQPSNCREKRQFSVRRTTVPARPSAQGRQQQVENSRSRSRNFHGHAFRSYKSKGQFYGTRRSRL